MRTPRLRSILTALSLFASLPAAGCLCGGFTGGGDTVYQRGSESLILCENGGFVANLASSTVEGLYHDQADGGDQVGFGTRGDDGSLAFDLYDNADGTASTPQLGDAPWETVDLNQVELDHANIQCEDLVNRGWWPQAH